MLQPSSVHASCLYEVLTQFVFSAQSVFLCSRVFTLQYFLETLAIFRCLQMFAYQVSIKSEVFRRYSIKPLTHNHSYV